MLLCAVVCSERVKAEFQWKLMHQRERLTFLHGVIKVAVACQRGKDRRYEVGQVLLGVRPGGDLLRNLSFLLQHLLLLGDSTPLGSEGMLFLNKKNSV